MKKSLFLVLLLVAFSFAALDSTALVAGMRSNRYAFVGFQTKENFGVAFENSVQTQSPKKQYARLAAFYVFDLPFNIHSNYAVYGGMRYDKEFYDVGTRVELLWKAHERYLQLNGVWQPFYDSDYGRNFGYLVGVRSFVLPEVGVVANFKNIPEYRDVERRVSFGLVFETDHLSVMPEISIPVDGQNPLTRVFVSFVYYFPL